MRNENKQNQYEQNIQYQQDKYYQQQQDHLYQQQIRFFQQQDELYKREEKRRKIKKIIFGVLISISVFFWLILVVITMLLFNIK